MSDVANLAVEVSTLNQLQKVAQAKGDTVETLVNEVIRQFLQREAEEKMRREMMAFRQQHAELWATYPQQYVALHQGQLIDYDSDRLALWQRIEANYPDEVILIRQVTAEIDRIFEVRSPRLIRHE